MSLTNPTPPGARSLGNAPKVEGFTRVGDAALKVVDDLRVKVAARALADRDCVFDGSNIVIPCASHGEAIRLMTDLRVALGIAA